MRNTCARSCRSNHHRCTWIDTRYGVSRVAIDFLMTPTAATCKWRTALDYCPKSIVRISCDWQSQPNAGPTPHPYHEGIPMPRPAAVAPWSRIRFPWAQGCCMAVIYSYGFPGQYSHTPTDRSERLFDEPEISKIDLWGNTGASHWAWGANGYITHTVRAVRPP